jgi:hypothetical protein
MKIEGKYIAMSKKTNHTPDQRIENAKLYTGSVNFSSSKTSKAVRLDGSMNPASAASYITKYVIKACQEFRAKYGALYMNQARKFKVWTKSAQIAIFTHNPNSQNWEFINLRIFDRKFGLNLVTLELSSRMDSILLAQKNALI